MSLPPIGSKTNNSLKHHLLQVFKTTGRMPEQIAQQPELPQALAYLWHWFTELRCNDLVLSYAELEAWSRLTRKHLTVTEVEVLRNLDFIRWEIINVRRNS